MFLKMPYIIIYNQWVKLTLIINLKEDTDAEDTELFFFHYFTSKPHKILGMCERNKNAKKKKKK